MFIPTEENEYCKELSVKEAMIKIDAVSGSGKTSELVYIAESNIVPSLYLAFNKSMQVEAERKFPHHVLCKTVHGLAYGFVGKKYQDKLSRPRGKYINVAWTGSEVARYFRIKPIIINQDDYLSGAFIGLVARDTVTSYEHSGDKKVTGAHIPSHQLTDIVERYGVKVEKAFKKNVLRYAKALWEERVDLSSDVMASHDTYLKLYQLSKPDLSKYGVIYIDESQDSNGVTLSLVLSQKDKCKLIFVGDKRQAIYGWRGAVNALAKLKCKGGTLTQSFRYGPDLATIATEILEGDMVVKGNPTLVTKVGSFDVVDTKKPYTILYRTNLRLLEEALDKISDGEDVGIDIDTRDYINLLKSAQALYQGDEGKIKHEDILPYTKWADIVTEAKTGGVLKRIVSAVEYDEVESITNTLNSYTRPENPHVTLSTAHKSKGLEYDQVILADDFPSNYDTQGTWVGISEQEQNLLYVAATRAIKSLQYNSTVLEFLERVNSPILEVIYPVEEDCKVEEKQGTKVEADLSRFNFTFSP